MPTYQIALGPDRLELATALLERAWKHQYSVQFRYLTGMPINFLCFIDSISSVPTDFTKLDIRGHSADGRKLFRAIYDPEQRNGSLTLKKS
jgi:hypothetical protein